jgi:hypothetical protein
MLTAIMIVKLVAEIAGLALAGQWILGLLAGARKEQNFFYLVLAGIGKPFVQAARLITPKIVLQQHLPLVAFLMVFFIWLIATTMKIQTCLSLGAQACR